MTPSPPKVPQTPKAPPGARARRAGLVDVPDEWGIESRWFDVSGQEHVVAEATIARLRESIGSPGGTGPVVVRTGDEPPAIGRGELVLEDGRAMAVDDALPARPAARLSHVSSVRFARRRGAPRASCRPGAVTCPRPARPGDGPRSSTPRDRTRAGASVISQTSPRSSAGPRCAARGSCS